MADDRKDSVGDQWTGTGNGTTITLDNVALTGMRAASGTLVDGATYNYRIQNAANTEWEDNRGVYTASGITLVRGTPTASSNAGSRVSFSAGVKAVVFGPQARDCDIPNAATGANIASASTVDLTARTGGRVHITGTTTITAITLGRGPVTLIFDGILTLTHHATNNALPGAANITTAAGDRAIYESDGATVYCIAYISAADGQVTLAATQTLTNKTLTSPVVGGALSLTGTSGGQIVFPGTQNASAGANTLDDYEEGTWTPVITFVTPGNLSVTYTNQLGWYTKIGRLVVLQFTVLTSAFTHSTASGLLQLSGLPFTSTNAANFNTAGSLAWAGITNATYPAVAPQAVDNAAVLFFAGSGSGAAPYNIANTDVPSGGTVLLRGHATYITA